MEQPMYKEIPTHLAGVKDIDAKEERERSELRDYRLTHKMPWYLRSNSPMINRRNKKHNDN